MYLLNKVQIDKILLPKYRVRGMLTKANTWQNAIKLPKILILSGSNPNSTEYSVKGAATVPITAHICSAVEK